MNYVDTMIPPTFVFHSITLSFLITKCTELFSKVILWIDEGCSYFDDLLHWLIVTNKKPKGIELGKDIPDHCV
jgi:hypothetical protein